MFFAKLYLDFIALNWPPLLTYSLALINWAVDIAFWVIVCFLQGCTIATGDYDELLLKLDDGGQSGVTLHGGSSEYSAGAAADAHLALEGKFWSITDGGEE